MTLDGYTPCSSAPERAEASETDRDTSQLSSARYYIVTKKNIRIFLDSSDLPFAESHTWFVNKDGYAQTNVTNPETGKKIPRLMHRMLLGAARGVEVDHWNRDKLDNRRENLRLATHGQNAANRMKQVTSKNEFKGVRWSRKFGRWFACCTKNRKAHTQGPFLTEYAAASAYDRLALALHGEFARVNFPEIQFQKTG